MKFTQRLAYYLSGFSIGLIILMFFLNGSKASCSCDYGPNARTVKNISSKSIAYSETVSNFVDNEELDSTTIKNLIKYGKVVFSKSNINLDSCKIYYIENSYKERDIALTIKNCNSLATIVKMAYTYD